MGGYCCVWVVFWRGVIEDGVNVVDSLPDLLIEFLFATLPLAIGGKTLCTSMQE